MTGAAQLSTGDREWGGRLPLASHGPLTEDQLAAQQRLRAEVVPWARTAGVAVATAEGDFIGPFNAFVHRPAAGMPYLAWVLADQAQSSLAASLREIIILTVGTAWNSEYEIYVHTAMARHAGVTEPVIGAVLTGHSSTDFSSTEAAVHRFTDELARTHSVRDDTYRLAIDAVGQTGVLDMVNLIGAYLATSALLNAFRVPAPPQAEPG
ncbi:carboxymuconolactone decarboxylase family protein [Catenulispora sp. NL8]|uniref:Carboxymuconolactone decarboxylase family protein n=1 Tax=Catenulispora pinistramenti TaxID=2705254 RepID=A0ABS5KJ42_9ACTN|nr:carboxymuconolactone decarboxylase family protein [Catenulispora pinistramenti]MBS2546408.1 carboxymuconolactone decarboxylase family protein [Catenulispora pinistramenti]